jgi:membrane-bound lytic murein transglycosylase A
MLFRLLIAGYFLGLLAACGVNKKPNITTHNSTASQNLSLVPLDFKNIRSWNQNNFQHSFLAFQKSCHQVPRFAPKTALGKHPYFGNNTDWQSVCRKAQQTSPVTAKQFFEQEFQPVLVQNDSNSMFTGYYIPELRGNFFQTNVFRYPLYAKPTDNGKLPPRSDIVTGALNGRTKPILWVDSEIDSFFLHIQGSGNVRLPDNHVVHVAYAGQNGHPYYAIGRYLGDKNAIPKDKISAQSIKQWLANNPSQAQMVMNQNPSYVFFKLTDNNTQQAQGAAGVFLTPEYSLAVDDEYYPYGLPMWVETGIHVPIAGQLKNMAFERLMVAQDTGGAIKGAVRGDIFFGTGKNAEIMASEQKYKGRKFLLLPRQAVASAL